MSADDDGQVEFTSLPSPVFIDAARQALLVLSPNHPLHITLSYLVASGTGYGNAKTIDQILEQLKAHGMSLSGKVFQTTLLKATRESDVFIGSGPNGFFLIESLGDACVMRDFYLNRIAAEEHHLGHLVRLARKKGWHL